MLKHFMAARLRGRFEERSGGNFGRCALIALTIAEFEGFRGSRSVRSGVQIRYFVVNRILCAYSSIMPQDFPQDVKSARRQRFFEKLTLARRSANAFQSTTPHLLDKLMDVMERAHPGVRLNFEDTTGFSLDAPEFQLKRPHRIHSCEFCEHARALPGTRCIVNKMAANRKAHRLEEESLFDGQCYLGLSELVMPFRFRGKTLGVFYCGSVLREETVKIADERLEAGMQHLNADQEKLRTLRQQMPVLNEQDWQALREDFLLLHDLALTLLEALDLPIGHYRPHRISALAREEHDRPPLVRRALNEIRLNFHGIHNLAHLAEILHCSPDHLSRQFKNCLEISVNDHIHHVRVEHGKHRLRTSDRTVEEIAYSLGYLDKSHFLKHFKRVVGIPPSQYRRTVCCAED